jgi:uncharacterized protein YlxP (DUF503 family)
MTVAVVRIRLALPSRDLKAKRAIVRSLVERLRTRFNAAVAEVDDLDRPGHATIAAACLSNDPAHADAQAAAILAAVHAERLDAEVIDVETELIHL